MYNNIVYEIKEVICYSQFPKNFFLSMIGIDFYQVSFQQPLKWSYIFSVLIY